MPPHKNIISLPHPYRDREGHHNTEQLKMVVCDLHHLNEQRTLLRLPLVVQSPTYQTNRRDRRDDHCNDTRRNGKGGMGALRARCRPPGVLGPIPAARYAARAGVSRSATFLEVPLDEKFRNRGFTCAGTRSINLGNME